MCYETMKYKCVGVMWEIIITHVPFDSIDFKLVLNVEAHDWTIDYNLTPCLECVVGAVDEDVAAADTIDTDVVVVVVALLVEWGWCCYCEVNFQ